MLQGPIATSMLSFSRCNTTVRDSCKKPWAVLCWLHSARWEILTSHLEMSHKHRSFHVNLTWSLKCVFYSEESSIQIQRRLPNGDGGGGIFQKAVFSNKKKRKKTNSRKFLRQMIQWLCLFGISYSTVDLTIIITNIKRSLHRAQMLWKAASKNVIKIKY